MRASCSGLAAFVVLFPFAVGCQQTNGPIPNTLTPTNPYSAANQLSPVRTASAVGPFGGAVRVPPPATGSYTVPNNYMGGTAPVGTTSSNQPYGPATNGVAGVQSGSGWVESGTQSFGSAFAAPSGNFGNNAPIPNGQLAIAPNAASNRNLGGMRVIDLTSAPPPPGYTGHTPAPGAFRQTQIASAPPTGGWGNGQFNGVAPTSFTTPINGAAPPQMGSSFRPITGAVDSIADSGGSVLTPGWNGVGKSDSKTPSTNPVNTALRDQTDQLQWRRPLTR